MFPGGDSQIFDRSRVATLSAASDWVEYVSFDKNHTGDNVDVTIFHSSSHRSIKIHVLDEFNNKSVRYMAVSGDEPTELDADKALEVYEEMVIGLTLRR